MDTIKTDIVLLMRLMQFDHISSCKWGAKDTWEWARDLAFFYIKEGLKDMYSIS